MSTIRSLLAAAVVLGLGACSSDNAGFGSTAPYCPRPTLVADLQSTEKGDETGQLAWTARLGDLASICDPREFDYFVEMDVTVDLRTGPAFDGSPVQLAYFVAVTNESGEVVDKQTFPVVMQPGRNERRALRRETLRQRLPRTYQDEPAIWSVLVGFEPTAQQVRDRTGEAPATAEPPVAPEPPATEGNAAGSGQ
ncbi:hypothetical protein [Geminicoccus roseus]|uniref:hypothetical protein n=1 Tax=Geminicoccus roseus TaxID=404900 RepID=UPI0012FB50AB|nr:hypothetical protein [Geminicoccus roseus]